MTLEVRKNLAISVGQLVITALFLALLLAAVAWHLAIGRDLPGKRESVERLVKGPYRVSFLGGVVIAGTATPLALTLVALATTQARDALAAAIFGLTLIAGYVLRLLTLRVGIFPPVRSMLPVGPITGG
jgi:hypothetical protein